MSQPTTPRRVPAGAAEQFLARLDHSYGGDAADSVRAVILEQVANGVAVRMAVLYLLLAKDKETGA